MTLLRLLTMSIGANLLPSSSLWSLSLKRLRLLTIKSHPKGKEDGYQREAAYHTRKGDPDRAKDYNRRADRAMDDYKTQMRYAANADEKAADYLKRAARLL